MRNRAVGSVAEGVRTLFDVGTLTGLSDGQLLERYLRRGDDSAEAAFRALVDRHGPMVFRACRGVLHDAHAAEDAFQATFLILARKAGAIRRRDSVASWLFGVARRVAGRAAMQRRCRAAHERRRGELAAAVGPSPDRSADPASEVQEEVDRLPERYRAPVVLCYLEGLTQEEAATRLRLPASTVRVRLMRARSRLRDRLTRRGLGPGSMAGLSAGRAETMIPAPIVDETVKAAIRIAVGRAAGASAPVAALVEGAIRAMFLARLKAAAALLAGLSCTSCWILSSIAGPSPPPPRQDPPAATEQPKVQSGAPRPELGVTAVRRSRWERKTTLSGSVVSYGSVDVYPRITGYLGKIPVGIGDLVKRGDVLATIDDPGLAVAVQRASAEVERARARAKKAEAAVRIAQSAAKIDQARAGAAAAAIEEAQARREYQQKQLHRLHELAARGAIETRLVDERQSEAESAQFAVNTARSQLPIAQAAEEEARARIPMAEAELAEARSELEVARAALREAQIREGDATLRAPFNGVVTRVNYHDGALVRPPGAGNAEPITTVVRSDIMLVVVDVPEGQVPSLNPGDPAMISIGALGERGEFRGSITRMAYALNPRDKKLRAQIALSNADGRLQPGFDASVTIDIETRENVITVPNSAVAQIDRGTWECLRVVDGRAKATRIKVGDQDDRRVEVLEGLKEGDIVITEVPRQVSDGQPVTIRPAR